MTTIAWDGKTLAADSAVWYGDNLVVESRCKLKQLEDGAVIAGTGKEDDIAIFIREMAAARKRDPNAIEPLLFNTDQEGFAAIMLTPDGKGYRYGQKGIAHELKAPLAMGCDASVAMAAMYCGWDAIKALYVAEQLCDGTRGPAFYAHFIDGKWEVRGQV